MRSTLADYYSVDFEAHPPLLRGRVQRPLSAAEFTETCELLLAQARRHDCPYWLLDGRADEDVRPPCLYQWLTDEFLPRVSRTLGRMPYVAFVARPSFWQALQAHAYGPLAPAQLSATFRINWFTDEAPAAEWLNSYREKVAASK